MIQSWMKLLLAILLGNVIYFLGIPYLPNVFAHATFKVDAGLGRHLYVHRTERTYGRTLQALRSPLLVNSNLG
jgi:hypothetical protein